MLGSYWSEMPYADAFPEAEASHNSDFSIDDYGGSEEGGGPARGPFQIVEPTYPAPKFLKLYRYLDQALRECQTLCTLRGRPYRVVRWGREGSGARGGIPCKTCGPTAGGARFTRIPCAGCAAETAKPLAEMRPNGQKLVFDNAGRAHLVGKPDYVVSRNPFPRTYNPRQPVKNYMDAVMTGQALASRIGERVFICSGFGADCKQEIGVPVVYVDPGGLVRRYQDNPTGTVETNPVSEAYFQELVAEGRGRSYLPWGS
jgi:hypothetical protein